MKEQKLISKKICVIIFKSIIFSLSIIAFFYGAMLYSVNGYVLEPYYFSLNALFLTLAVLIVLCIPWFTHLLILLFYTVCIVPTIIVSSYINIYKNLFSLQAFFFIWGSNPGELGEFIKESCSKFPLLPYWCIACFIIPFIVGLFLMKEFKYLKMIKWYKRLSCGVVVMLLLSWLFLILKAEEYNYIYSFYSSYLKYNNDRSFVLEISKANKERIKGEDISSSVPAEEKETYVVVIGESAARHHMGMFGYPRLTDPCMQKLRDDRKLFAFNNVIATSAATTNSLLRTFSFIDQKTDLKAFNYSIIDIFNQAGFRTFWFSNNAVMLQNDTILQALSVNAFQRAFVAKDANQELWTMQRGMMSSVAFDKTSSDIERYKESLTYDDVLLPYLDASLKDAAPKKIIFLHLKGSHMVYQYRYPNSFDHFIKTDDIPSRDFDLAPNFLQIINFYDNSIYYTDYLLSLIQHRLEQYGGRAWMLYFSDHGEDVCDAGTNYGRDMKVNKYMIDTPLFAWFSDEYLRYRNLDEVFAYSDRIYRLDDLMHSILDIANIKTKFLELSRSIFSSSYIAHARVVNSEGFKFYLDLLPVDLVNFHTVNTERKLNAQFLNGRGDL